MVAHRVWQQTVSVEGGIGYLRLSHPDGREAEHLFSPRLYDEVVALNWSDLEGYAYSRISKEAGTTQLHWVALGLLPGRGIKQHVDHLDHNSLNSQDYNLMLKPKRGNDHNREHQSKYGACITKVEPWESYKVEVNFGSSGRRDRVFTPGFKTVTKATECRDLYLALAVEYDSGNIAKPTKAELQTIAESIRRTVI